MKNIILFMLLCHYFTLSAQWIQLGQDIDGASAQDNSGYSVALSGDGSMCVIGARNNDNTGQNAGHARVFAYDGAAWNQLGSDLNGEAAGDLFGYSVSMSADGLRIAVGAVLNDGSGTNAGHVRVYQHNGGNWVQLGNDIDGEAPGDEFGRSVSLSDDGLRVAVGAIHNDGGGGDAGHVRVFAYDGNVWVQLGGDINGEASGDNAGFSVSLSSDGSKVAVGAYLNDGGGTDSGQARIFQFNGSAWMQLGSDINGEAAGDECGTAVALSNDGNFVAIGADKNDGSGTNAGQARIYQYNMGSWEKIGSDLDGEAAGDEFGYSISVSSDGSVVAIGGRRNNGAAGHVRVFQNNGSAWQQLGADIDGEAAGDESGNSVCLSEDGLSVVIGAQANAGNGTEAGHARIYQNNLVLPVELSYFLATATIHGNTLSWQTAVENVGHSFEIERSTTGLLFQKIGEIKANDAPSDYHFTDHAPFNGMTYYRLCVHANDGSIHYSNIQAVQSSRPGALKIYPAPAQQTLTIQGVMSYKIFSQAGDSMVSGTASDRDVLNIAAWPSGVYIIMGTDENGQFFSRTIVKCTSP